MPNNYTNKLVFRSLKLTYTNKWVGVKYRRRETFTQRVTFARRHFCMGSHLPEETFLEESILHKMQKKSFIDLLLLFF